MKYILSGLGVDPRVATKEISKNEPSEDISNRTIQKDSLRRSSDLPHMQVKQSEPHVPSAPFKVSIQGKKSNPWAPS